MHGEDGSSIDWPRCAIRPGYARSVSTLSIRFRSEFSLISSVTMLLLLTIVRQAFSLQIVWISSSACAAVSTQMTRPPRSVKTDSNSSSCLSGLLLPPFDILGPFACEVQIGKLLLTLWYNCVIAADIEIYLFAVVRSIR